MATARCLCGAVGWELDGPFQFVTHCHCSRCRKTHGTPFATYAAAPADTFRLHGADHVVRWESSPGFLRPFCRHCGSVVPGEPYEGLMFVPAGNFLGDFGGRPVAHIFVASKAPWYEIRDPLPQFAAYPDAIQAPVIEDRPALDPPGAPRGSCLCGAVTYVLEGEALAARNCHCGRCRQARSAAHAANLVMPEAGVRFTRGAEGITEYKIPEARFFTQAFCRTCGSCVPRVDRGRQIAIVPLGGLDDHPARLPQEHIFVADKAPWFDISDDLPQHPGPPPPS